MNILFINLPKDGEVRDLTSPDYLLYDCVNYPPLGLLAISAKIDPRHSLRLLDTITAKMTIDDVVKYIEDYQPDLLAMSVVTRRLYPMYAISKRIKESMPKTKIVAGGPHINYFPHETMKLGTVDYVLPGYGEKRFPQLIEAIDSGTQLEEISGLYYKVDAHIKVNTSSEESIILDEVAFPNRKLINIEDYFTAADKLRMTTVYTSRGCPYRCIYCDVQEKKFHYRSPKNIVDEFEEIAALGVQEVFIFDDTFNLDRQRVIDMCLEILKRGLKLKWSTRGRVHPFDREMLSLMKQAGCRRIHVGVESLDSHILKIIKKKITLEQITNFFALCNEIKIDTLAYFMIGFPEETAEYRQSLFKEIRKLKPTYVYINLLFPSPKTEIYERLLSGGVYKRDHWKEFVEKPVRDFVLPPWQSLDFEKELMELADGIHRKFYFSPHFIINDLKRNTSLKMICLKAKIAVKLFLKITFKKH